MSDTIKLSEYTQEYAWHQTCRSSGKLVSVDDIPHLIKWGEEGEGFFAVRPISIVDMAAGVSAEGIIESILEHVSNEVDDGDEFVEWALGEEAAKAELDEFFTGWRSKHLVPNNVYEPLTTRIDVSEVQRE